MELALSPEQLMLQTSVRELLARSASMDLVRAAQRDGMLLEEAWIALGAAGFLGLLAPESVGGAGLGVIEAAIVAGECGRVALPAPVIDQIVLGGLLASENGEVATASAIIEGNFVATIADVRQDGVFAPFAERADIVLEQASSGRAILHVAPLKLGSKVDGTDLGRPLHRLSGADRQRVLLMRSDARPRLTGTLRVLQAADACGAAFAAFDHALAYVGARQQFNRPLSDFQAIRHQLADIAAALQSAESLLWYAAALVDEDADEMKRTVALAKAHITEQCVAAIRSIVVLHGAIGFAWENDLHIWLKRAMTSWSRFGTPRELRLESIDCLKPQMGCSPSSMLAVGVPEIHSAEPTPIPVDRL